MSVRIYLIVMQVLIALLIACLVYIGLRDGNNRCFIGAIPIAGLSLFLTWISRIK